MVGGTGLSTDDRKRCVLNGILNGIFEVESDISYSVQNSGYQLSTSVRNSLIAKLLYNFMHSVAHFIK